MKSIKQLSTIIALFLFIYCDVSLAQTTNDTYRHISSRDGLSSGFVWDMIEDQNGFIWIATDNGLDKYDGYSITNYRSDPSDINSITAGPVFSLMEDQSGMIWAGTAAGLSILNPSTGRFHQVRLPGTTQPLRTVRSLVQIDNGTVWIGAINGIYRVPVQDYFSETLHAELFDTDSSGEPLEALSSLAIHNNTLWISTNSGFHKFNLDSKEFIDLPPFDEAVNKILTNPLWQLLVDSNETLWITSTAGLVAWHKEEDEPESITALGPYNDEDMARASFQSLTEDKSGRLWIGSSFLGAIRFDIETGEVQTYRTDDTNQNSIREDDIHYAFVDSQENTWFGYHNHGMSLMYSLSLEYALKYASDDHEPGDLINTINQIKEDASGNLWFSTDRGLVLHPSDGSAMRNFVPFTETVTGESINNQLFSLVILDDQIIAGTSGNSSEEYLLIFDIQSETFDNIPFPDSLRVIMPTFTAIDNFLYLGTLTRRLVLFDRSTYEYSVIDVPGREPDDFEIKPVVTLLDSEGNILIRSYHIYELENKQEWDSFLFDPSNQSFTKVGIGSAEEISTPSLPQASRNQPGIVWSIQNSGLLREDFLNEESQLYFQADSGILSQNRVFIYEDKDGYLWLGETMGITKLDPVTETLTYYEVDQGRRPNLFYQPNQLSNGDLVFPGRGGYIQFNPNELTTEQSIQNIHITELWSGSDTFHTLSDNTQSYELDYANNNISVAYLGLNYRDPNFTRYRYRLNGYDDEWNYVGTQRRIFLANLPPGEYNFQVQAATRYGGFSEGTPEIRIAILPPWWRTIPAYIMYALLFIGGVITVDRVQRKRVIRNERERTREKELEQAKEIETAYKNLKAAQEQLVQQEKLASLGQLTAGIAHEIKNPLNFVNNFSEVSVEMIDEALDELRHIGENEHAAETAAILADIKSNLAKIYEHGSRADGIVKSMLQHSRGGSGEMEPTDLNALVKEYVNLSFHGMRAGKDPINVDIDLDLDEDVGEVPLVAEDFSRVIVNLCNNAFDAMREKLTGDGGLKTGETYMPKLTVRSKSLNNNITIDIEDNGPGIPEEMKDKILQPFFTTKKGTQGTGLGLSITNDIIKAHGGTLEIETQAGKTIFTITLSA